MAKRTTVICDEPRVRFNGGFWDGFAGAWRGRLVGGHFDQVYAAGVVAGEAAKDEGQRPETSDAAWAASDLAA